MGPETDEVPTWLAESLAADNRELEKQALGAAADALGSLYSGVLLGSVVHDLAVMRTLGVKLDVVDRAERWPAEAFPPSVSVQGRSAEGVSVSIRWHYLESYPQYREEVRWHDNEGSVELVFPSPYLLHAPTELMVRSGTTEGTYEERFQSPVDAFDEELKAFHAMVTAGEPPRSGVAEGAEEVVTCLKIAGRLAAEESVTLGGEAATLSFS